MKRLSFKLLYDREEAWARARAEAEKASPRKFYWSSGHRLTDAEVFDWLLKTALGRTTPARSDHLEAEGSDSARAKSDQPG